MSKHSYIESLWQRMKTEGMIDTTFPTEGNEIGRIVKRLGRALDGEEHLDCIRACVIAIGFSLSTYDPVVREAMLLALVEDIREIMNKKEKH